MVEGKRKGAERKLTTENLRERGGEGNDGAKQEMRRGERESVRTWWTMRKSRATVTTTATTHSHVSSSIAQKWSGN